MDSLCFVTLRVAPFSPVPSSKPRVALTLDQALYDELKAVAAAERRPLANLIESWVVAELERRRNTGS